MSIKSDPECRLYVGNLSYSVNEDDLRDIFNTIGLVNDVYLPRVYQSDKHKGFGFIEMSSSDDAFAAIVAFSGQPDPGGRTMIVRFADLRRSKEDQQEHRNKLNNRDLQYDTKNSRRPVGREEDGKTW